MSFDRIDRQFAARPPRIVVLECVGCGSTDDVATRKPAFWELSEGPERMPLCLRCGLGRHVPTNLLV